MTEQQSTSVTNISRRNLIKTLGLAGGFVVAVTVVPKSVRALGGSRARDELAPSVYLAIDEDGTVHVG